MSDQQKDPDEIGALWEKSGNKGTYFTGTVNGERIVVFRNGNKRSDKAPDFRILKSRPKPQTTDDGPTPDASDIPF